LKIKLFKYRFLVIVIILVFNHIVFASNTKSGGTDNSLPTIPDQIHLTSLYSSPTDSFSAHERAENDYISSRYVQLKTLDNCGDTIRKSSDKNIELLNRNGLSALKTKGENNFLARNFFSIIIKGDQPSKGQMAVNSSLYFAPFAGRKIGNIRIQQLGVFGPTLLDTLRQASGWLEKTGNAMHLKTTERKLRGQLLFDSGDLVNPQLMAENEKFIRDLPYIEDVAIILSPSPLNENTVDVRVIIKERLEYGISGDLSATSTDWEVTNQNMFGIGHQFSAMVENTPTEIPKWGGRFRYQISDLDGKFIRTGIGYTNDYRKNKWNTFIEKRFIESKGDWAGGISLDRAYSDYFQTPYSYTMLDTAVSYFNTDLWYGQRFKNKNSNSSLGNVILTGRYSHQNYYHNAYIQYPNTIFRNHDFILGAIGLSKRELFKNNQVYGYGITEDIPYGHYAEMAAGLDVEPNVTRPYFHFNYSQANILDGGAYFKWQVGLGGFLNNSQVQQGAILLSTNYFSNFLYINRHPYRLFVNMELLSGINRFQEEYLMINRKYGVRDYFSLDTKGTKRLKINVETVRFWGWEKAGFRVAHYFFADAACLSTDFSKILDDQFIGGIGAGIRIYNESLVFNVLEIRFSWIPIAPHNTTPVIFNIFGQPKARFDDFLGGKPQEIPYK